MKVYLASDHAGFEMKEKLVPFVQELGYEVEDCGAHTFDAQDDYPAIIAEAARKLSADVRTGLDSNMIILGGSGQGEAMVANRFKGVRAAVYYGAASRPQVDIQGIDLDMIASSRVHNDANALSLGARFLSSEEIQEAVRRWLTTACSSDQRHVRRVRAIDEVV